MGQPVQQWFLSLHALQRMRERRVGRSEVIAALNDPEALYPDLARPRRSIARRGRVVVCFENDTVLTVWCERDFVREAC